MTEGDSAEVTRARTPLREARIRLGWSQAAAMRRFAVTAEGLGAAPPVGASLKRMFAYWEAGERAVSVPEYQRAFMAIYGATPEALGFVPPDDTGRIAQIRGDEFALVHADDGLVALLEAQTQGLRMVDRQLGSSVQSAVAEAHVRQIEQILHRCVGDHRAGLGAALAGAATLAGWQALDRGDINAAWALHELAKDGARESGDAALLAHATAQQSTVLLDAGQPQVALELAGNGIQLADTKAAPILRSWLLATAAEAFAAAGDGGSSRSQFDRAQRLFSPEGAEAHPSIMLTAAHLDRWHGHCLAELGDPAAVEALHRSQSGENDSVRAATGLHADLALALHAAGREDEAAAEAVRAKSMADRFGSARQRRRLRAVLARVEGQNVEESHQGS